MDSRSRLRSVSRRTMLKQAAAAGLVVAVPGLACASGDADVLSGEGATSRRTQTPDTPQASAPTTGAPSDDTAAPDVSGATDGAVVVPGASAIPLGGQMVVDFNYSQQGGGKDLPPYVATWIEHSDGTLIETIHLWFLQDEEGPKWLDELRRWFNRAEDHYDGDGDLVNIMTSATRLPGSYSVAWSGLVDGEALPSGTYTLCVESAREDGPYSLVCQPLTLTGEPLEVALGSDTELSDAVVRVTAG